MTSIPAETVQQLNDDRQSDTDLFYSKILGLRENNWSLRKIADELSVSTSGVARWVYFANQKGLTPRSEGLPLIPKKEPAPKKPKREKVTIPSDTSRHIRELTELASEVRRNTPRDHPARLAAERLEDILHEQVQRGVTLQQLADAANRTRRAIAQRLEKRELRNGPSPSEID